MKKNKLLVITLLLISLKSFSCDCIDNNPALEFYASKYVFSGTIISKVYAKDSLTYNVQFEISKHYKTGDSPKKLEFTLGSEGMYTGSWTSCDWNANMYEQWLVYAYEYKGKLRFSGMCSNSQLLGRVSSREQKMLDNATSFNINDFVFRYERDFNYTKPISDIDAIINNGKIMEYSKPYVSFDLLINKKGKLRAISRPDYLLPKKDTIFNLGIYQKVKKFKPKTEFEKEALKLVKQFKKWEIKKHEQTGASVRYIKYVSISFDLKKKKWKYQL